MGPITNIDLGDLAEEHAGAEKLSTEATNVHGGAGESSDESNSCSDDPTFLYKNKPDFDCGYIAKNKPAKCFGLQNGVKIGISSCPKSCNLVNDCKALTLQLEQGNKKLENGESANDAHVEETGQKQGSARFSSQVQADGKPSGIADDAVGQFTKKKE